MPKYEDKNNPNEPTTPQQQTVVDVNQQSISDAVAEVLRDAFSKMNLNAPRETNTLDLDELKDDLDERILNKKAISVAFPECADVMLSLINPSNPEIDDRTGKDEITDFFNDYFLFRRQNVIVDDAALNDKVIDQRLLDCQQTTIGNFPVPRFPAFWCQPPSCVSLLGIRHLYSKPSDIDGIKRLFVGDLMWLFYFDRMGIFKIIGAILDDFAIKGRIPISNGSVNKGIEDDLVAIVLEAMVRKTETGASSTVRRRNISYRRCFSWILEEGRKLQLETVVNTGFNSLFHKFIQTALEFYKDKRLATAITGVTSPVNKTSVATLTSIKDTIDLLKRTFEQFDYGRNYSNTLSGIVWVIAAMGVIRKMRTTLGIPSEFNTPDKFIPAAYDLLVMKNSGTMGETNRYDVHRDCAENARDILLDLEIVAHQKAENGQELEKWLDIIEVKIEGYRTAYRSLTGVDLGAPGTPMIEQQV